MHEADEVNRRNFSHAFSEKSLRDQEPIFMANIQKLIVRLREVCDKPVDISAWLNYVTFDVMGFLTFGDNFGCLDHGALHVSTCLSNTRGGEVLMKCQCSHG